MTLFCSQSSNLHGKSTRFNSISQTNNIQDVSTRTVVIADVQIVRPGFKINALRKLHTSDVFNVENS